MMPVAALALNDEQEQPRLVPELERAHKNKARNLRRIEMTGAKDGVRPNTSDHGGERRANSAEESVDGNDDAEEDGEGMVVVTRASRSAADGSVVHGHFSNGAKAQAGNHCGLSNPSSRRGSGASSLEWSIEEAA